MNHMTFHEECNIEKIFWSVISNFESIAIFFNWNCPSEVNPLNDLFMFFVEYIYFQIHSRLMHTN